MVGITSVLVSIIELVTPFLFDTNLYVSIIGRTLVGLCEVSMSQ